MSAGDVLLQVEVALGLGHVATVVITEAEPDDPPKVGATWDEKVDHVRASIEVRLPNDGTSHPHPDLRCEARVLGERVNYLYGWGSQRSTVTVRTATRRGPVLADLADELYALACRELAEVQRHVAARIARLAQRERALEDARRAQLRPVEPPPLPACAECGSTLIAYVDRCVCSPVEEIAPAVEPEPTAQEETAMQQTETTTVERARTRKRKRTVAAGAAA